MQIARHQTPREGLEHPAFVSLSETDHLLIELYFDRRLDDEQLAQAEQLLQRWYDTTDWDALGGPPTTLENTQSRVDLKLRIGGPREPVRALLRLVTMYRELGVDFQELWAARWTEYDPSGLMGPISDPRVSSQLVDFGRMSFPDPTAYLRFVFDHEAGLIGSENPMLLKGALELDQGGLALEARGHLLHVPGVRIGFGICENYERIAGDGRTAQIERALREELERSFSTAWDYGRPAHIPIMSSFAREQGMIDTIVTAVDGQPRRGYEMMWFADALQLRVRHSFRQREPELMEALGAVIRRMGLDAVITWIRVGRPLTGPLRQPFKYYAQLWEKPGYAARLPSEPRALTSPPESTEAFYDEWFERRASRFALRRKPLQDRELLSQMHGVAFPPDLTRLLELRDVRSLNGQVYGPLELDDNDIPLRDAESQNLAEFLLARPSFARCTFSGFVPLGYLRESQATVAASVLPAGAPSTGIYAISHQSGGHFLATSVDAFFAAIEALNEDEMDPTIFEGKVNAELELAPVALGEVKSPRYDVRYSRSWWWFQLLGLIELQNMVDAVEALQQCQNSQLVFDKVVSAGNHHKSSGGVCLPWVGFFTKDPRLPALLEACEQSRSSLVRDNAKLLREIVAGRRAVGNIEDIWARREEFLTIAHERIPETLAKLLR